MIKFLIAFASFPIFSYCQKPIPIRWFHAIERVDTQTSLVTFSAMLNDGWHLYSQFSQSHKALSTKIQFSEGNEFRLVGSASEDGVPILYNEPTMGISGVIYFGRLTLTQKIESLVVNNFMIHATVRYVACSEDICIPSQETFVIEVK